MKLHTLSWPAVTAPLAIHPSPDAAAFLSLAGNVADIAAIHAFAAPLREKFTDLIVVGAGGSGMSGKLLTSLAPPSTHRVHVLDNLDTGRLERLKARVNPKATGVLFISKSGTTAEVVVMVDIFTDWFRASGLNPAAHMCAITTEDGNPLHQWALREQLPMLGCDANLGGRFSVLSAVGLLPAAFMGVDIARLREAAAKVDKVAIGCAVAAQKTMVLEGKPNHVMMVYDEALLPFARWWQQVFSESLGKDGRGAGAVIALGPRDQHSQLQLYMEGPADYYFTFMSCGNTSASPTLSANALLPEFRGKSLQTVVDAMRQGTIDSMVQAGKPVRHIHFDRVDETAAAVFLQTMMMEVVALGEALGINPFGQPAVEVGKRLTKRYLI
jgi:glucose-6-phosphate isomerase